MKKLTIALAFVLHSVAGLLLLGSSVHAEGSSAVDDALAAALGQASETSSAQTGPPLTRSEMETLRGSQQCWNAGSLSGLALETTVVVAVSLTQDGKPVLSSIRLVASAGGTNASAKQAFEVARRAIIRCGASGFKLPISMYDQWKDIEMTFNPRRIASQMIFVSMQVPMSKDNKGSIAT